MSGVGGSDLVIDHLFLVYDLFLDVVLDSSFMLIVGLIGDGGHVEPLAWSVDVMIQQMALYVSVFVFIIHPGANCLPDWRIVRRFASLAAGRIGAKNLRLDALP